MPEEPVDLLKFYRSEIQFESQMLSSRLNSFISSQSFLLIAYGSSMGVLVGQWRNPFTLALPPFLGLLGLVLALQTWPGIRTAYAAVEEWHKKQGVLLARHPDLEIYFRRSFVDFRTRVQGETVEYRFQQGTMFTRHSPWILSIAWCYFTALPVVMYLFF
ncbi:hypothetical protein [Geminicoccus roseus]|uniref:hypothetical protein n=1 Tax=Geminicoccus roseus TaxID=404900 RepID=UPI0004117CA0|nr:hypothetical protein [Geminicoccus roseus]